MRRVKIFWTIALIVTTLLAVLIAVDTASADSETETATLYVGGNCDFELEVTAWNDVEDPWYDTASAFAGLSVQYLGNDSDSDAGVNAATAYASLSGTFTECQYVNVSYTHAGYRLYDYDFSYSCSLECDGEICLFPPDAGFDDAEDVTWSASDSVSFTLGTVQMETNDLVWQTITETREVCYNVRATADTPFSLTVAYGGDSLELIADDDYLDSATNSGELCVSDDSLDLLSVLAREDGELDELCLTYVEETCTVISPCYIANHDFSDDLAEWETDDTTISETLEAAIIAQGGYITQDICLPPGEYYMTVSAGGLGASGETIYGQAEIDGAGFEFGSSGVSAFNPDRFVYEFSVSESTTEHELRIRTLSGDEIGGGSQAGDSFLVIFDVCIGSPRDDTLSCGLIRNSEFVETSPFRAAPWYAFPPPVNFAADAATVGRYGAVAQSISGAATYTAPVTYTMEVYAQSANGQPAPFTLTLETDIAYHHYATTLDNTGVGGWDYITVGAVLTGNEVIDKVYFSAGEYPVRINHACLWLGDPNARPTDTIPISESFSCALCDIPAPDSCDPWERDETQSDFCSVRRGKPYWDGSIFGVFDLTKLGYYIGWWVEWLWCWLKCWFEMLIAAIRRMSVPEIPDISLPTFDWLFCALACWWEREMAKLSWFQRQFTAIFAWLTAIAASLWSMLGYLLNVLIAFFSLFEVIINFTGNLAAMVTSIFSNSVTVVTADVSAAELSVWDDECVFWAIDLLNWLVENSLLLIWYFVGMVLIVVETGIWLINKLRSRS